MLKHLTRHHKITRQCIYKPFILNRHQIARYYDEEEEDYGGKKKVSKVVKKGRQQQEESSKSRDIWRDYEALVRAMQDYLRPTVRNVPRKPEAELKRDKHLADANADYWNIINRKLKLEAKVKEKLQLEALNAIPDENLRAEALKIDWMPFPAIYLNAPRRTYKIRGFKMPPVHVVKEY